MDVGDFESSLRNVYTNEAMDELVNTALFEGIPPAFENRIESFERLKDTVALGLDVDRESVTVVGSARTGFSLDPERFPTVFRAESDIDVLIVSERLFDESWLDILTQRYVTPSRLRRMKKYLDEHRNGGYIYRGWIWPDRITSALAIGSAWFDLFRRLPSETGVLEHAFHGRLYRTWDHARHYHSSSLRRLRDMLMRL